MIEAIEAGMPRQQYISLLGYVSAGDSTVCLEITLFTLGEWRQLSLGDLRAVCTFFIP